MKKLKKEFPRYIVPQHSGTWTEVTTPRTGHIPAYLHLTNYFVTMNKGILIDFVFYNGQIIM
jgi:hypothetical protein